MNDLEFDGLNANNKAKALSKYSGNQSGETMKGNYGRPAEALKGATFGKTAGPSTAAAGGKIDGGRKWDPKCDGNYVGNSDKIQERQMPNRTGNKQ